MTVKFNTPEEKLIREIASKHADLSRELSRIELALKVAIACICASRELDGDWRILDDMSGLVRAVDGGEATARVQVAVTEEKGGS